MITPFVLPSGLLAGCRGRHINDPESVSKMPKAITKLAAILALALPATGAAAQDVWGLPDSFSATQISQLPPTAPQMPPWKIYKSGTNFRTENEPGQSTIYLPGSNKIYDAHQNGAVCAELPMDKTPTLRSPLQQDPGVTIKKKPVGTEVFEGHSCTVEDAVLTSPDGHELHAKVWEANDLKGFPVKIEALGAPTFIFRDVVLATPDPALFQPPAKCPHLEQIKPTIIPTKPVKK